MGLFEELMRISTKSDNTKKSYTDVTDELVTNSSLEKFQELIINSKIDVKVKAYSEKPKVLIRVRNKNDIQHIKYQCSYEGETCVISVAADSQEDDIEAEIMIYVMPLRKLCVGVKSADVVIGRLDVENIKVVAGNGDVLVKKCAQDTCEVKTESGDITIDIDNNDYVLSLNTNCGNITKNGAKSKKDSHKYIKCKSESGDILINKK